MNKDILSFSGVAGTANQVILTIEENGTETEKAAVFSGKNPYFFYDTHQIKTT
jgi:hypothetical protein